MTFLSDGGGRRSLKPLNDEFQMGKVARLTHLHTVWRQISMRNQRFTCISEIGEENGRKSTLERGRWRLLEGILASLWNHLEFKNRLRPFGVRLGTFFFMKKKATRNNDFFCQMEAGEGH